MPMDTKIICHQTREDLVTDWIWRLSERSKMLLKLQACKGPCTQEESQIKELPLPLHP